MDLPSPTYAATVASGLQASDITAIASVVVAVCALFITLWQAWSSRQHAITSLRPLLIVSVDETEPYAHNSCITIYLENVGLGPAIIKSWDVYSAGILVQEDTVQRTHFKDMPEPSHLAYAFKKLDIPDISVVRSTDKKEGFALKSGSKEPIFVLSFASSQTNKANAYLGLNHLKLIVEYQDLYKNTQPILDTSKNKL
ncbi:hypothetical protein [Marinomonas lutimaris]|uniref:hypothetical protein n=1 Tax=Marinomonas lutimaris TaxID=2846746 RepID=UPI001CA52497|nr:hypothetical protein [Marinomonas lutimaris]